jgi:DnaJ-domain-containing protein 1
MKTVLKNEEIDNLVLFPSAKNFPIKESLSDPLYELLNEYSHLTDDDIPNFLDDRFEDEILNVQDESDEIYPSLEAFMNRHKREDVLSPDEKLAKKINAQIEAINDAKERIKFYLEEIDIFLPRRR